MEMILIKHESDEWNYMWEWLAAHPLNKQDEDPMVCLNGNEAWQYMGSYMQDNRVVSEFRHRNHPAINDVLNLSVSHTGITEDDIAKRIAIR